jgi:hypothetical protein
MRKWVFCENCGAQLAAEWGKDEDGDCLLVDRCACDKIVTCWYKDEPKDDWMTGFFLQWSQDHEEFETGPGNFPVAIIEDATDSRVHIVYAGHVSFSPDHPDAQPDAQPDAPVKPPRFQPRMHRIGPDWIAFQVHPEVVEMFHRFFYQCQARWIEGEVDCHQGGIPVNAIKGIFLDGVAHETS